MGHDDQPLLPFGKGLVNEVGQRFAHPVAEIAPALPIRVGGVLVFLHPCQILRVLLHLYEGLALEPAEVHLLQPVHRNELCPGKEHPCRLGGALQRGDIDHLR